MLKKPHLSLVVESRLDTLWRTFVDAKKKSEQTLRIEDGIAAGKAYGAFLDAFVEEERAA